MRQRSLNEKEFSAVEEKRFMKGPIFTKTAVLYAKLRRAEKNRKQIKGLTPQAMDLLLKYSWPGNVRELMNAIERGVVLSQSDYLNEEEFPLILENNSLDREIRSKDILPADIPLEEIEKVSILSTLESAGGNKSEAARRLGITRKTLHKKLKKYGLMP